MMDKEALIKIRMSIANAIRLINLDCNNNSSLSESKAHLEAARKNVDTLLDELAEGKEEGES